MSIKIKQQDNVFMVKGSINVDTLKKFKNHIEFLLLYTKGVAINMDYVTSIDANGLKAIYELQKTALRYKKTFIILGAGSNEIYNEIKIDIAA